MLDLAAAAGFIDRAGRCDSVRTGDQDLFQASQAVVFLFGCDCGRYSFTRKGSGELPSPVMVISICSLGVVVRLSLFIPIIIAGKKREGNFSLFSLCTKIVKLNLPQKNDILKK